MSRRAVGGASAVGCGVFGLGGVLISVAIVVWLGSIALDGSTGTTSDPTPATTTAASLAQAGAAIAVDPATGFSDGDELRVIGTDLPPGAISLTACLAHAPTPGGARCDVDTATVAAAGTDGALSTDWTVRRVVTVQGVAYDCAAAPGACTLRASPIGRPGDPGTTTALAFAAGLPPIDAEAPPTG